MGKAIMIDETQEMEVAVMEMAKNEGGYGDGQYAVMVEVGWKNWRLAGYRHTRQEAEDYRVKCCQWLDTEMIKIIDMEQAGRPW